MDITFYLSNDKYLESSLTPCPFSNTVIAVSSLRTFAYLTIGSGYDLHFMNWTLSPIKKQTGYLNNVDATIELTGVFCQTCHKL